MARKTDLMASMGRAAESVSGSALALTVPGGFESRQAAAYVVEIRPHRGDRLAQVGCRAVRRGCSVGYGFKVVGRPTQRDRQRNKHRPAPVAGLRLLQLPQRCDAHTGRVSQRLLRHGPLRQTGVNGRSYGLPILRHMISSQVVYLRQF